MDVKETEFLHKATSEEEVLEYVQAVMQLYRENAKYLDRIYKWVAKVGLEWVTEQVTDEANRKALNERFAISQSVYQKDPWAEHVEKEKARYTPIANLALEAAE